MINQTSGVALWALTQAVDYMWAGIVGAIVTGLFGGDQSPAARHSDRNLALACLALGVTTVVVMHARELTWFAVLGDRVPACKRKVLSPRTRSYLLSTTGISMASFFTLYKAGIMRYTPPSFTAAFWLEAFAPFYAVLVLRDVCFLAPLHKAMHASPVLYRLLHKTHHEVGSDAQALHAFHIDAADLVVENVGAPLLLLAGQRLLGRLPLLHWLTALLLTMHDGALHSVNPFSAMYFNPLLDWLLKANVNHQLHHALNAGHLLFVPWSHVFRKGRQTDCRRYNQVFKTTFEFPGLGGGDL